VLALDNADAAVIALDFDQKLAHPDAPVTPGDYLAVDKFEPYRNETATLVKAIGEVAKHRKVVLPKTIWGTGTSWIDHSNYGEISINRMGSVRG